MADDPALDSRRERDVESFEDVVVFTSGNDGTQTHGVRDLASFDPSFSSSEFLGLKIG